MSHLTENLSRPDAFHNGPRQSRGVPHRLEHSIAKGISGMRAGRPFARRIIAPAERVAVLRVATQVTSSLCLGAFGDRRCVAGIGLPGLNTSPSPNSDATPWRTPKRHGYLLFPGVA